VSEGKRVVGQTNRLRCREWNIAVCHPPAK
jgi:hypothetical protein